MPGLKDSLREALKLIRAQRGLSCKCIRCREYGHKVKTGLPVGEPVIDRMDYEASGGREIFLSFEDEFMTLFGLLRLRIQGNTSINTGFKGDTALVRELHVYGPEVVLGNKDIEAVQHKGMGKSLLAEAERIALCEFSMKQIAILSGVGAREYYRSEGYKLENGYMIKELKPEQ